MEVQYASVYFDDQEHGPWTFMASGFPAIT